MFLRRHRRTKNGKTHIYYALLESVRTEASVRDNASLLHLGELNHEQERRAGNAPSGSITSRARIGSFGSFPTFATTRFPHPVTLTSSGST